MKSRVNLTVEKSILQKGKKYAKNQDKSLSELFEEFLATKTQKAEKEAPLYIKMLGAVKEPVDIPKTNKELYGAYYEDRRKKYGF